MLCTMNNARLVGSKQLRNYNIYMYALALQARVTIMVLIRESLSGLLRMHKFRINGNKRII